MFDVRDRESLARRIVSRAEADPDVTACALVGSAARGDSDAWSDIDVALQIAQTAVIGEVAASWTSWLGEIAAVADTLDVHASGALYRVFLLDSSLQIDVSFWPSESLRSNGGAIRVVFGQLQPPLVPAAPDPAHHIKMGWLYALHARSAIARGRAWQAESMLSSLREQVMTLTCIRLGLDPTQGRQAHRVPDAVSELLIAARAASLEVSEQQRSLGSLLRLLHDEAVRHDVALATSLTPALRAIRPAAGQAQPDAPRTLER